ncbi:hypothetical protein BpHYR1_009867 [Brachionus plicatilis]|uniref:Uncharacterized protein n=1 Tax=Brachionus plicatilis TaxID=10195 RepID=A0A3M7SE64_BRAPC|nr:hypothetical protein BpHYR1_009867 [Brachionus plicatilis]
MIGKMFKKALTTQANAGNKSPFEPKPENMLKRNFNDVELPKTRFGPNLIRITVSYFAIIAFGITTFYFAKKEIDHNRQETLKIKQQILDASEKSVQYPSRFELLKAEREAEAARKHQSN